MAQIGEILRVRKLTQQNKLNRLFIKWGDRNERLTSASNDYVDIHKMAREFVDLCDWYRIIMGNDATRKMSFERKVLYIAHFHRNNKMGKKIEALRKAVEQNEDIELIRKVECQVNKISEARYSKALLEQLNRIVFP